MATPVVRRPLPALVALVALLVLTGIVWWRVMNRDVATADGCRTPSPSPTPTATSSSVPAPAEVTVQVLNSTTRTGLAGTVRRALVQRGFAVPGAAGNDKPGTKNPGVAQLRFGPAGAAGARLLQYYLPGATLVPSATTAGATVTVAVGAGFTAVRSDAAVRAALAKDRVRLGSPTPSPTPVAAADGC